MIKIAVITGSLFIVFALCLLVRLFIQEQQTLRELKEINSKITSKSYTNDELMIYLDSLEKTLEE